MSISLNRKQRIRGGGSRSCFWLSYRVMYEHRHFWHFSKKKKVRCDQINHASTSRWQRCGRSRTMYYVPSTNLPRPRCKFQCCHRRCCAAITVTPLSAIHLFHPLPPPFNTGTRVSLYFSQSLSSAEVCAPSPPKDPGAHGFTRGDPRPVHVSHNAGP